jgi:ABC-type transport system substrate-binding protein
MKRLTLVASLFIMAAVLLAACVAPAPAPQAPAEEEKPTTEQDDQPTSDVMAPKDWYDPADVGASYINLCPDDPPRYGGTIVSADAAGGLRGSWLNDHQNNFIFNHGVRSLAGQYNSYRGEGYGPELVESWEISDDLKVWTLHVRQGVKFHDGTTFDAHDLKFTFEVWGHPEAASGHQSTWARVVGGEAFQNGEAEDISGVKLIDDFTIEITWISPYRQFFGTIANENVFSKDGLEGVPWGEIGSHPNASIGTGPFKLVELVPDQYYVLERNEDYWEGRPYLDKIIFRFGLRDSMATWVAALEAGEIQAGAQVSGAEWVRMVENPNTTVIGAPIGAISIWPNNDRLPDKRVRQAMMYALDLHAIREGIWKDEAVVYNWHTFDPGAEWMSPDIQTYSYDPEKAKALLAEVGWDPDRELDLYFYYGADIHKRVTAAMQQYWADVGVKVNTQFLDIPTLVERRSQDDYDMIYGCCFAQLPDTFEATLKCGASPNTAHYCNEEFDSLAEAALAETDPEKAKDLWYQVSEIVAEDLPLLPFWQQDRREAISANLCNYRFFLTQTSWADRMTHTWYLKE